MIAFNPSPSCLNHLQIRAVWVPAASSCAFLNIEKCKDYYINLLANDVILLLIMLVGLLRLRLRARAFLDLASILWKQVRHCSCWL